MILSKIETLSFPSFFRFFLPPFTSLFIFSFFHFTFFLSDTYKTLGNTYVAKYPCDCGEVRSGIRSSSLVTYLNFTLIGWKKTRNIVFFSFSVPSPSPTSSSWAFSSLSLWVSDNVLRIRLLLGPYIQIRIRIFTWNIPENVQRIRSHIFMKNKNCAYYDGGTVGETPFSQVLLLLPIQNTGDADPNHKNANPWP